METGKVEFAPDYKSQVEAAMSEGRTIAESVIAANKLSAERSRLEREVIEKAKRERAVFVAPIENVSRWTRDLSTAQTDLRKAVEALVEFESSK